MGIGAERPRILDLAFGAGGGYFPPAVSVGSFLFGRRPLVGEAAFRIAVL